MSDREERMESNFGEGTCQDCEFSTPTRGLGVVVLTCDHKDPSNRLIVEPDGECANFKTARELLSPEVVKALAGSAKLIPLT